MSEEKSSTNNENTSSENQNITIKKSTYNHLIKGMVIAIAIAAFVGGYSLGTFDNSSMTSEELEEIISKAQIKTTPIPESTPIQESTQPTAPANIFGISLDDDPVMGNADAPITIVEFSDFLCPFCARFYVQTLPEIEEKFIDTGIAKLVYRDFPIDSLHPNARLGHVAAECADEQGKFWEYHDVLFENQAQWGRLNSADLTSQLNQYASTLGLDSSTFDSCLSSQEMLDEVGADVLDAAKYGANGTPTFFIGNEKDGYIKLVGAHPFATFQAAIDHFE